MGNRFNLPDDWRSAHEVDEHLLQWLVPQRFARGVIHLVAGRPGQGKSMFTSWLTAYATQLGERVIFSNLEDHLGATTRPRLRVAGVDLKLVSFWTPDVTTPEGLAKLEAVVRTLNIRLLIMDPITGHMTRRQMDDRAMITPLRDLCERTGLVIVVIHHTRKSLQKNAHPIDWVKGAGDGMLAAARMVYLFGRNADEPEERILVHAKSNLSAEGSMTFQFDMADTEIDGEETSIGRLLLVDPLSEISPLKIAEDRPGKRQEAEENDPTKKAVAAEWLTTLLMFGEMHVDQVKANAQTTGLSWRTIRRGADQLGIVKRMQPRGFGKGRDYFWSLPDGHPALKLAAKSRAAQAMAEGKEEGKKGKKKKGKEASATPGDLGETLPDELTVEDVLAAFEAAQQEDEGDGA